MLSADASCRNEKAPSSNCTGYCNPLALFSLTSFALLISSSILFAYLFEWDRYQIIMSQDAQGLTVGDIVLLFWLLVAKSVVCFLPVLLVCSVLIVCNFRKAAILLLGGFWLAVFYFLATDLIAIGFTGFHAREYWLPFGEFIKNPVQWCWRWVAEILTIDTLMVFGAFVIAGAINLIAVRWIVDLLSRCFPWLRSMRAAALPAALLITGILGVIPALAFFSDKYVLDRIFTTVPITNDLRVPLQSLIEQLAHGRVGHSEQPMRDRSELFLLGRIDLNQPRDPHAEVEPADEALAIKFAREAADPGSVDSNAFVQEPGLPNVVLIIFESFRQNAIAPGLMPKLYGWSQQGLQLQRHYCGSNCSHLGLFPLFYGRSSLGYHQNLDRKIPPQLFQSLRQSGYLITFLTSGETRGFRRLDQFINNDYCDQIIVNGEFDRNRPEEWPRLDRGKLARLKNLLDTPHGRPQFVFLYLVSTFNRYGFPPEFEIFQESSKFWQFFNVRDQIQSYLKRYTNSLLFLEDELMKLLPTIDLKRNIIMITGDHGESMGDDGVFRHGTRMSEIQMRVPCVISGAGLDSRKITTATVHMDIVPTLLHALAGRTVAIRNCQGRDLLSDRSLADEVVLAPSDKSAWEGLLIVRGSKRLVFRTETFSQVPRAEFEGIVDEVGHYRWKVGGVEGMRRTSVGN